jgi:hypothetical protein
MAELRSIEGGKRAVCIYCGSEPHSTPLACPRIAHLTISPEGYCEGITFVEDFFDEEETPPPDAA